MKVTYSKSEIGHIRSLEAKRANDLAEMIQGDTLSMAGYFLAKDDRSEDENKDPGFVLLDGVTAYSSYARPHGDWVNSMTGVSGSCQYDPSTQVLLSLDAEATKNHSSYNWDDALVSKETHKIARMTIEGDERIFQTERGTLRINDNTGTLTVEEAIH